MENTGSDGVTADGTVSIAPHPLSTSLTKRQIGWTELLELISSGAQEIKRVHEDIDTIVALSRGGLIPARLIAQKLNVKKVFSFGINFYNRDDKLKKVPTIYQPLPENFWSSNILVVDDIIDSGSSIKHVVNYINKRYYSDNVPLVYSVFFRPNEQKVVPNFYSELLIQPAWIVMPWE